MKDQFKLFKEQAGVDFNPDQEGLDTFAELIIEECARVCFELRYSNEGPGEQAAYQRTLCGTAIKEHFGLKSKGPISAKNLL